MAGRPQSRMRHNAGVVRLDTAEVQSFVEKTLLPRINRALRSMPPRKPIGEELEVPGMKVSVDAALGQRVVRLTSPITVISGPADSDEPVPRLVFSGDVSDPNVGIFLNGSWPPMGFLHASTQRSIAACPSKNCLPYALYSGLIHELTHLFDSMFPQKHVDTSVFDETGKYLGERGEEYINAPKEVRAHMQQIVDDALRAARDPALRAFAAKSKTPDRTLVDEVLHESEAWRKMAPFVSERNGQKVVLAVYKTLAEAGLLFK